MDLHYLCCIKISAATSALSVYSSEVILMAVISSWRTVASSHKYQFFSKLSLLLLVLM